MQKHLEPRLIRIPALLSLSALLAAAAALALAGGSSRAETPAATAFSNEVFASAAGILHKAPRGMEQITKPDDITPLKGVIYVAFQNGVGAQGEPSSTGNLNSTVVGFDSFGHRMSQWDLAGRIDGMTADLATGQLIATVNEDYHSSIYLIDPVRGPKHYHFNTATLTHRGGTDAITIYHGTVLLTASAPGTTGAPAPQANYPAIYSVRFNSSTSTATLSPLFSDEGFAKEANTTSPQYGQPVQYYLTDPDSSESVPPSAARFGGDFVLSAQGDLEQIFVSGLGGSHQALSVLQLSTAVDDSAWPTDATGTLYASDPSSNAIDAITGPFTTGSELAAVTPCNANSAPGTCPAPGYPANYLGQVDTGTGVITRVAVAGAPLTPKGLLFVP